jgi:hypothetical protein
MSRDAGNAGLFSSTRRKKQKKGGMNGALFMPGGQ